RCGAAGVESSRLIHAPASVTSRARRAQAPSLPPPPSPSDFPPIFLSFASTAPTSRSSEVFCLAASDSVRDSAVVTSAGNRVDPRRGIPVGDSLHLERMQFAELGDLLEGKRGVLDEPDGGRLWHQRLTGHGKISSVLRPPAGRSRCHRR